MLSKKILIGTANFGKQYGIKKKKIGFNELKKIIRFSNLRGIKFMDTAKNYNIVYWRHKFLKILLED